jgi:hypothetical protein
MDKHLAEDMSATRGRKKSAPFVPYGMKWCKWNKNIRKTII